MKEIGGYFELDAGLGHSPLPSGVLLNSGRNALRHIVRMLNIRSMWVPDYTCPVVYDALHAENVNLRSYHVGADMLPIETFDRHDFILYTNYFGCLGKNVEKLASQYSNLIVDCAHAYFAKPKGLSSFSSCRKFFGVADGGVAYGVSASEYDEDDSSSRQEHLLIRRNSSASAGYAKYREAEEALDDAPIKAMSKQTKEGLLKIDCVSAIQKRRENFAYLHAALESDFPFAIAEDDVPMVYPLVTDDESLRTCLIENKIFVAKYWQGIASSTDDFANRIIPIPIDQRYGEKDMKRIVEVVRA